MLSTNTIVVDLDGTITLTDTLHESVLSLLRRQPLSLFLFPFWMFRGKAYFKSKVAERCTLEVSTLPYNQPLIDWLRVQKAEGKVLVLCSAASEPVAAAVANYLGLFDEVIGSDTHTNLKGPNKREALQKRFGPLGGYAYAGNSLADVEVWAGATSAIVVNASSAVHHKATRVAPVSHVFPPEVVGVTDWLKALRVHQWLKNILLAVPLVAAHQIADLGSVLVLLIAFLSFSLCASSVYIVNDLLDLESDRRHPRKKFRPFASAKLTIPMAVAIAPLLVGLSIFLGAIVGHHFLAVLLSYFSVTFTYSIFLKRLVLLDCLTLAILYTIRIIAGAVAVSVDLSFWLLAFSVFIFLSLALVKRYAELIVQIQEGKSAAHGRGYVVSDAPLLQTFGVASGYISALVVCLYIRSEEIISFYAQPKAIWLIPPIILGWVSWVWLKSARGQMHDDPIVFAIKDRASRLVAALVAAVLLYAATGVNI